MMGAILGTQTSPCQASAVKEDRHTSSWATSEKTREGLGGADAPTYMLTPKKIKWAIMLGDEAPK
jgi:hypothetical protein